MHQLQIAASWGTGAFSSSDGQRSPARGRAATADAAAREFGYRRGAFTLVNWVTDQYSQYGTKVVSVAEREAIHTLEAILHTQLPIAEHTTDTHGTGRNDKPPRRSSDWFVAGTGYSPRDCPFWTP